jgi:hypothetical protein
MKKYETKQQLKARKPTETERKSARQAQEAGQF